MKKKTLRAFSVLCFSLLPIPALAQCKDRLCQNIQNILFAAITDFRGFRANGAAVPDVSIQGTRIPCQMTTWANNVSMAMCFAQVPVASAESWYGSTLDDLRVLQPGWQFKIDSPASDHFVDAGPPECEVPATEGPNLGHCPLHLQTTKQNDGTTKVYLWMSSLSSPYLMKRPPGPPPQTPPLIAGAVVANGCDDLCQGLKKVFEARVSSFEQIRSVKDNATGAPSDVTVKLTGAGSCTVSAALKLHSREVGTQYVCYWPETSASAAETRFRDLVARLQILVPSNWAVRQGGESEELTGTAVIAWYAVDPGGKQEVSIYLSGQSVGLHIKAWN